MDFAHEQQFSAKKASGLGVVLLVHALLAGGLIYGLSTKTLTYSNHTDVDFLPPPPRVIEHPHPPIIDISPKHHDIHIDVPPVNTDEGPKKNNAGPVEHPPGPIPGTGPTTDGDVVPVGGGGNVVVKHGGTNAPVLTDLDSCKPVYPRSSLLNEEEGTVRLRMEVGVDNRLLSAAVVKSSGFSALDKAALGALSKCTFKSALQDGTPVQSSLVTDYVWSLGR